MKAVIDSVKCIGCTLCAAVASDVFRMKSDKAIVFVDPVPQGSQQSCRDALQQCPVEAISLIE